MKYHDLLFHKVVTTLIAALLIWNGNAFLSAQEEDDGVVIMSPYEVEAATGYTASSTLAGTRLNSNLRDVPQQISVMTGEFLEDIAATSQEDAMLYSLNVENLQEYTDPGNLNQGINFNDFGGRIRGIATVGRTRDFFETNLQADTYNLERLTISSGPNAVIYGLSGTGGVVNSSFKRARLNDSSYTLGTRVDQRGSRRLTLDLNQVLVEDKLAARLITLWDDFQTHRDSSDGNQARQYVNITTRPWSGANFNAWYEHVNIDKTLVRNIVALDGGVTAYEEHVANGGDPFFDNSARNPDGSIPEITGAWADLVQRNGQNRDYWLHLPDGSQEFLGQVSQGDSLFQVETIEPRLLDENPADRAIRRSLPADSPIVSRQHNVHGFTTERHMYGEIYGASYTQEVTDDLFLEFAVNKEYGYTDFGNGAQPNSAVIRVDPNMYLPDGVTENPYRGMRYVDHWGQSTTDFNKFWSWRSSASYNLDLTEHNKWLGRHMIMGLYTEDRYDRFWSWIRTRTIPADQVDSYVFNAGSGRGQGQTYYRWYLDENNTMINPWNITEGGPQPDGSFVYARGNAPASGFTWSSLQFRSGATGALQSFWFDERVVTTFGYRQGWFKSGGATVGFLNPGNTDGQVQWGRENIRDVDRDLDVWGPRSSEDAINYGAVVHLTTLQNRFGAWSVFYNFADIFNSPSPSAFADGSPIPASIGESRDYGIMWTGFDGKAGFRLNLYRTLSDNVNNCSWCSGIRNRVVNIERKIGLPGAANDNPDNYGAWITDGEIIDADGNTISDPPVPFDSNGFELDQVLSHWHMVANRKSKGTELEAWANPTQNLTLRLTMARNKATDVDGLRGWKSWILERYDYWRAWAEWEQTAFHVDNPTQPLGRPEAGGAVTNQFQILAPDYVTLDNADGVKVNQNSSVRLNSTVRYNFSEGFLQGSHIGTHFRWRKSPTIGYISLPADNPFSDFPGSPAEFTAPSLDSPVKAPSRTDIDMFAGYNGRLMDDTIHYSVRLNIRNVLNANGQVPQSNLTDGTIAVYTFKEPRTFILSVDLTY